MNRRSFLAMAGTGVLGATSSSQTPSDTKPHRFRVIDAHMHVRQAAPDVDPRSVNWTADFMLNCMNRGGVEKAVLITFNADDLGSKFRFDGGDPIAQKRIYNLKYQLDFWRAHKDRFWWFTGSVNPLREGYLERVDRDLEAGASGVKLLPIFFGLFPDHHGWMPVYDLCRKRRKPIIMDESWWYFDQYPHYNETPQRQEMVKSLKSFSDYAHVLDPIFRQYSDVPFSLAHCGSAQTSEDFPQIFDLIARHKNLTCDVGLIAAKLKYTRRLPKVEYGAAFLRDLVKTVGAHKVMYGSDGPAGFDGPESYLNGLNRWTVISEECTSLSDAERQMILAGNAERFVNNQLPEAMSNT
jgi:predicted TIM-barrel fold metal-dependent hydrolase